jgi:hypothetical protein
VAGNTVAENIVAEADKVVADIAAVHWLDMVVVDSVVADLDNVKDNFPVYVA